MQNFELSKGNGISLNSFKIVKQERKFVYFSMNGTYSRWITSYFLQSAFY